MSLICAREFALKFVCTSA